MPAKGEPLKSPTIFFIDVQFSKTEYVATGNRPVG